MNAPFRVAPSRDLVFRTVAADPVADDPLEYVLSDASVDRYGDVIEPGGWKLTNFRRNPMALFNHSADNVVGGWRNVHVKDGQLRGHLELVEEGTSLIADTVRKLVRQGFLRAVSVGFRALKKEPLAGDKGGYRFIEQELVETSLVSIPANPNALQIVKALGIPADQQTLIFGQARPEGDRRLFPALTGKLAESQPRSTGISPMKTNVSQRIEAAQNEVVRLRDRLSELATKEDAELTDEERLELEELPDTIDAHEKDIDRWKKVEAKLAPPADPAPERRQAQRDPVAERRPFSLPAKKIEPRDYLLRAAVVMTTARGTGKPIEQVLRERYPEDEVTNWIVRAAVAPADTVTPGWAAELVQTAIGDFLDTLKTRSVYPELSGMGARFTFGRNAGAIKIPARTATPTVNGDFVGEGAPIPVRRLGLTSVTLTPKKLAVISEFTREVALYSTPSIEQVLREAMADDTAVTLDTRLLDTNAATAIRPAGLLNGVTPLIASAAATASAAMVADLKAIVGAIIANKGGRNLAILVNPEQALGIGLNQTTTGDFVFDTIEQAGQKVSARFISSLNVTAKTVIGVDAADFASATGDTPEYLVSDQATIHEEDTTPLAIGTPGTPTVVAAPTRSLFQTATLALRMILDMNWAMRRTGMVSVVHNVIW